MMNCEAFEALLDLYVDGELSPEEYEAVRAHLNTCPACRAYVEEALSIRAAFPKVEEIPVPEGFEAGVMARIAASAPQRKARRPWGRVLLPLAACFALVLTVQSLLPRFFSCGSVAPESPAAVFSLEEEAAPESAPELPLPAMETRDLPEAHEPETKAARQKGEAESLSCFVRASLSLEEAGTLLDGALPIWEDENALLYALSREEYAALTAALAEKGLTPEEEFFEGDPETALVMVLK